MCVAKSKDTCEICNSKVKNGDEGLECDECDRWYHAACEGVNKPLYEILKQHEKLLWLCGKCEDIRKNRKSLKNEVEEKLKEIEEKMKNLKMEILEEVKEKNREWYEEVGLDNLKAEVVQEVSKVSNQVERISKILDENLNLREDREEGVQGRTRPKPNPMTLIKEVRNQMQEEREEEEDRRRRAKNLVIYNIPESNEEELGVGERTDLDTKWCIGVFEKCMGVNVDKEDIEDISRLGLRQENGENKDRPILLKLKTERMKWEILKNAKNLKNATKSEIKKIGIAKDMTKMERELSYKLRKELKDKRESGESGWKIKNWKLIREEGVRGRYW